MNSSDNNNLLSREEAWWFIPEEYCPIFLELEKKFNKQIDIRRQISELESKINDTPAYKREPLKERLKNLNARREHFSREKIVEIVEFLRDDRCIHYRNLANSRLANPKNADGEEDYTFRKFFRYADIMRDKSITKVIVDRFIKYFKNLGILRETKNVEYYFEHYSNHIANYKVPFITAQILLEYITRDLEHDSASRVMLLEAMHNLIQDPLFAIVKQDEGKEKALKIVYLERFKDGLQILKNNGFVKKKKGVIGHYEFTYEFDYNPYEKMSLEEARRAFNEERRKAALDELHQIHARFHLTTSTSKEKKKARLRSAQSDISEKLSKLDQSSKNGRITYHWYNVILQCSNSVEFRKFKAFADDVLTYIRYQNIKNAITPVDKDKLYRWEKLYVVWDALGKFIQEEAKLRIISWPISISDSEYRKAARNILKVIDDLIGNDTYKIVITSGQDESIVEQQKVRNDQIFSLFYVRAEVESSVMHSNATMHLEQLFNIITVGKNKNYIDLCLIIDALHLPIARNTFEYTSKIKLWEFALNNIPNEYISFDIQITKIPIYSLLLVVSVEEGTKNKYSALCTSILDVLQAENHEQEIELIRQITLFINPDLDILSYTEAAKLSYNLYVKIENMLKMGDGNNDPRLYVYKYELFAHASLYLSRYLDFGYSLPILLSQAYSHLKTLKINYDVTNYGLQNNIAILLKNLMPAYSLRIIITSVLSQNCGPLSYHYLINYLLQSNNFELALEYVAKAEQLYDCNNLGNIQVQTLYLDLLLNKVRILLYWGRETEAKAILLECDAKIKQAEELYPPIIRSRLLQEAVDSIREVNLTLETRPFIYRWLRLLYILMHIEKMNSLTNEVELFYKKWDGFNGLDLDEDKSNPTKLLLEFKSEIFPSVMETVAQNIDFNTISIDTTPITEEEITRLNNELKDLYEREQHSFIKTECLTTQSEALTYDMLFKLFEPKRNAEVFVHKMKLTNEKEDSSKRSTLDDLELYHYIALSEYVSKDNKLSACQRFVDSLDIDRLNQSERYVYLHEMAAEVLCQQSCLVEYSDWDTQEKLLNHAESYIVNKDGSIISDRAKEIYIRIMHRLYDVYDYQERSGMQESLMVEHALELIKSNNIRTVDAAWFLGERAEYLLYINKDKQQAKTYFDKAISILKEIIPATEDSLHYLDIYQEKVVNL